MPFTTMTNKKITVGVLLSNSTIVPMAKNFNAGLKRGLKQLSDKGEVEVEVVPEFIGQGSKEQIEAALNKLISFDDSDVITGIISNKVMADLSEKIANTKRPFIINNIGEHLPETNRFNEYIFLNSLNTWQQLWSLGKWAVNTLGKRGMYVSGLYDCGYSFQVMLDAGMQAAASDSTMSFAIAPTPNFKELADVGAVFQHIENFKPDFIMATFCGEEASIFLEMYVQHGYHKTIPLLGLPFLLEPFSAQDAVTIYTTMALSREPQPEEINGLCQTMAEPFTQFGYETGQLIAEAVKNGGTKSLQRALAEVAIETERGRVEVLPQSNNSHNRVFVIKNTHSGNKDSISRELIGEVETIDGNHSTIEQIKQQPSSGWVNPYLGV